MRREASTTQAVFDKTTSLNSSLDEGKKSKKTDRITMKKKSVCSEQKIRKPKKIQPNKDSHSGISIKNYI